MTELTLAQRLRSGHVKRWHMVRVLREQTLAEHLMLVQIVALEAADRFLVATDTIADPKAFRMSVMEWSMWHDMPEVVTGDISTPMKRFMAHSGVPELLHAIEKQVDGRFSALDRSTSEIVKLIVKFADLYEAIHFLHWEGHGPRATEIERELIGRMADHIKHTSDVMMGELASIFDDMFEGMTYDSES